MSYQRLEFLGDSVINLCVAEEVYGLYPQAGEGELSHALHALVNNRNLYDLGVRIGLPDRMRTEPSIRTRGGGISVKMVADVVEAIAGAIFLDGGYDAARSFVREQLLATAALPAPGRWFDAKSRLQERCQKERLPLPAYRVVGESGPIHARTFRIAVSALGLEAEGAGATKKEAGMNAAAKLLEKIGEREGRNP